jgi:transcriptional regulator with XRE-family HTH domain
MSNENEIVKKIQKRMKDVLSEHNFTKEECANKFGISRNQLYVLLNHPDMKISFIIKFKEIFNIEFDDILCEKEEDAVLILEESEIEYNKNKRDDIKTIYEYIKMQKERIEELKYTIKMQKEILDLKEELLSMTNKNK